MEMSGKIITSWKLKGFIIFRGCLEDVQKYLLRIFQALEYIIIEEPLILDHFGRYSRP